MGVTSQLPGGCAGTKMLVSFLPTVVREVRWALEPVDAEDYTAYFHLWEGVGLQPHPHCGVDGAAVASSEAWQGPVLATSGDRKCEKPVQPPVGGRAGQLEKDCTPPNAGN